MLDPLGIGDKDRAMSDDKRLKPPVLNLGDFASPQGLEQSRSFHTEESTMITSLDDLERARIAKGEQLTPQRSGSVAPPPAVSAPSLSSLSAPMLQTSDTSGQETEELEEITSGQLIDESSLMMVNPEEIQQGVESGVESGGRRGGELVVVFNARGGVGASTLAVNLAGAAQLRGRHTAVIDLDLQLGSLSSMLEGKPLERSLAELVMEVSESDQARISSAIDERAGIHIIAQEGRIGEIGLVTPDRLHPFFEAVKAQHELVVIDGVRSFSDQAVTAMDAADVIVLVVTQDIPALRSARRVLSLFKRLGYQGGKVRLVVNRVQRKSFLSLEEIEDRLDHAVFMSLPNDFKFVSSLIESGVLAREMNLKHPVTRAFDTLACRLLGFEEISGRGGLLSSLFGRKKR